MTSEEVSQLIKGLIGAVSFLIIGGIMIVFCVLLCKHLYCIDHNWIIPPGQKSKITATISSIAYMIAPLAMLPMWISLAFDRSNFNAYYYYTTDIDVISGAIGSSCYYYYLYFNIRDEMQQNQVIKHATSTVSIVILKLLLMINFLYGVISLSYLQYDYFISSNIERTNIFYNIDGIWMLIETLLLDILFLFVYIRSLHHYARWWRGKSWQESSRYGINEREHEILIRITRFTVVSMTAALMDVICIIWSYIWPYDPTTISLMIYFIINPLSNMIHVSSIYFSFEFGHSAYLKVYKKIHSCCYRSATSRYRNVEVGYMELNESK